MAVPGDCSSPAPATPVSELCVSSLEVSGLVHHRRGARVAMNIQPQRVGEGTPDVRWGMKLDREMPPR